MPRGHDPIVIKGIIVIQFSNNIPTVFEVQISILICVDYSDYSL